MTLRSNFFILILCLFITIQSPCTAQSFVQRKDTYLTLNGQPYYYVGSNYWYGLFTILQGKKDANARVCKELDFLQSQGVTNLRMLASTEGIGQENGVVRVSPALQPQKDIYNEDFLKGLDFVLAEMAKRNMKAVLYLSNNWEWSGGFLQYLHWNGKISDAELKKKMNWDEQRDYTSQFYSCSECVKGYLKQVKYIVTHKNTINGLLYKNDPTIMSWEIANEPRPMRPAANNAYYDFIQKTASYIKRLDKNHLLTTGHEGEQAMDGDMTFFKKVHAIKEIDYLTIHIWPKNWGWFKDESFAADFPQVLSKTEAYIQEHFVAANELQKPMVIEEFGLPRDGFKFDTASTTNYRDQYYRKILQLWQTSKISNHALAGVNFWAFGGTARPIKGQIFWKESDDYSGDPPMEEQGLNSVFDSDSSTWQLIRNFSLSK
ncbi:glycoside hydrolase 5 family protein [Rhizosphaericola mali]|uniref:mannan endo-1,4-beta-mannosidase n=1 Tax=Rhizosphaericola mali TaxID=2545455 RepID=A0A5P2G7U2_9BACT|nr:beta-mannosidase [Rhizosphaericola mali]QES89840.1 beta-mannosidase [Rhizosphaericola mali]